MKKALVATFVLALVTATAGPVFADPSKTNSASAFGLEATGLLPIARTPVSTASQPPDSELDRNAVLEVPAEPLAIDATIGTAAVAHRESDIRTIGGTFNGPAAVSEKTTLQDVNSRGFARTDGLSVLVSAAAIDPLLDPLLQQGLVSAEAIQAEAVAKCVNNVAQFDTGFDIVGLSLAGQEIPIIDELVATLLDLGLLDPDGGLLAPIVTVETGVVTRPSPNTIAIDALVVTIPLLDQRIVVGHAEASMPAQDCGFECSDNIDNDGDGKIDFGPDPGCDNRFDDDERDAIRTGPARGPALAATGGDMGTLPLVAFGLLGGAVIFRRITMRSARGSS